MTDFNFLRIKWPKLAAIAADASRLVEVSPASAMATMQNFCEWAADIVLDLYDIGTQNGITQQEKLETLRATGHVPPEVIARFNNILVSGGRRAYRINEDVEEARQAIVDVYEIGRWLNKEADRVGWPPRNNGFRPAMSTSMSYSNNSDSFTGRVSRAAKPMLPIIGLGAAGVLIVVVLIIGISAWVRSGGDKKPVDNVISATPSSLLVTMPTDTPEPTPTPEVLVYLDTLEPSSKPEGYHPKVWKFNGNESKFAIGDKEYDNGIGFYIPSKAITQTQASKSLTYDLGGKYSRLRFDLGVDANLDYAKGYGYFRIRIYTDDDTDPVYDSKKQEYTFTALGQDIDIHNCNKLKISLTEYKGDKGTINVVLGDIRLLQGSGSGEQEATASPTGSGTEESASPTPSGSAKATATATPKKTNGSNATATPKSTEKATATPDPTSTDNGEQQPPP